MGAGVIERWIQRQHGGTTDLAPYVGAAELGHPCDRYVWRRIRGIQHQPIATPSRRMVRRMAFGSLVETFAEQALVADGWTIVRRQPGGVLEGGLVRVRPDFIVERDGVRRIVEVKSVPDGRLSSVASVERLRTAGFWRYRAWPVQAAAYARAFGAECTLWVVSFPSLDEVEVVVPPDLPELDVALERVRRLRDASDEPPPIDDARICRTCPFRYKCPGAPVVTPRGRLALEVPESVRRAVVDLHDNREAHERYVRAQNVLKAYVRARFPHEQNVEAFAMTVDTGDSIYVLTGRWIVQNRPEVRIPAGTVVYPKFRVKAVRPPAQNASDSLIEPTQIHFEEVGHDRETSDSSSGPQA